MRLQLNSIFYLECHYGLILKISANQTGN